MSENPVVKNYAYCLIHTPDFMRYGSKPRREIAKDRTKETHEERYKTKRLIDHALRDYKHAVWYPPNQTFIGNITPEQLGLIFQPWYKNSNSTRLLPRGPFGEIMDQETFCLLLKLADVLNPPLFEITEEAAEKFIELLDSLKEHPFFSNFEEAVAKIKPSSTAEIISKIQAESALAFYLNGVPTFVMGCFSRDNRAEGGEDENLAAHHLLENLCAKASGALAIKWFLRRGGIAPEKIDFIISCGEEACGDRYQRGGGGMAKAMGEMAGCMNASGFDLKNFCAAPVSAIITAASLVASGIYDNIVVVGGGSLSKLGMKFEGFVRNNMPILDDCLASMAFLISKDDGVSPIIRLDAIGKMPISAGTSDEKVYQHILFEPLKKIGLKITDIDKFAPELQNPEIMIHAGAGDVAQKNYIKIAGMAAQVGAIERKSEAAKAFMEKIGMPGFAPTQGHIPSAVPYLGHAVEAIKRGEIKRAMFLAKASLFLSRCTTLYDGVSFIIERNPKAGKRMANVGPQLKTLEKQARGD
ncbi:MAG: glycine reductase [Candidatus Portnoybacteria bacterium]|nr:glycine reductase [Candidatus Portnoybacteria bacterium]